MTELEVEAADAALHGMLDQNEADVVNYQSGTIELNDEYLQDPADNMYGGQQEDDVVDLEGLDNPGESHLATGADELSNNQGEEVIVAEGSEARGARDDAHALTENIPSKEAQHEDVDFFEIDDKPPDGNPGSSDQPRDSNADDSHEIDYDNHEAENWGEDNYVDGDEGVGAGEAVVDHQSADGETTHTAGSPAVYLEETDKINWERHSAVGAEEVEDEQVKSDDHGDGDEANEMFAGERVDEMHDDGSSNIDYIPNDETDKDDFNRREVSSKEEDFEQDDEIQGHMDDDHAETTQPDDANQAEEEFPAITVHYKNYEYPLFSLDTEGFFSDLSVLEDSVDLLLAGFRAELADEITSDDYLVFQVDELGLEFSELTSKGTASSITLQQILEIFDILVKNQDPEGSRTLYTYLFTRTDANKRFEFLMESASAGKSLDEVARSFSSPSHGTEQADAINTGDVYEEETKNYGSGDYDESAGASVHQHSSEDGDAEGEQFVANNTSVDSPEPDAGDDARLDQEDDSDPLGSDGLDVPSDNSFQDLVESTAAKNNDQFLTNDTDTNEGGLFLNIVDDGPFEPNDAELDQMLDPVDVGQFEDISAIGTADNGTTNPIMDTSLDQIIGDETPEGDAAADATEDADIAEIDWRDGAEIDADLTTAVETPSVSGKRVRSDDDEESKSEEQDAKRQRS